MLASIGTVGIAAVLFFGSALWSLLGNGVMLLLTASSAILLIALDAKARSTLLPTRNSWLASVGRLSYEIYLSHMFVIFPTMAMYGW